MRTIRKAFKFRICPNQTQQAALAIQFGHARFVYNWGLSERKHAYEITGKGLSYNEQANALKAQVNDQLGVIVQKEDSAAEKK